MAERLLASFAARDPKPGDPILVNSLGERWKRTTLSELYTRMGKRAGIATRVSSHTFRRSLNMVARKIAKLDAQQRAELLSHSSTATLNIYDRLDAEEGRYARQATWDAVRGLTNGDVTGK